MLEFQSDVNRSSDSVALAKFKRIHIIKNLVHYTFRIDNRVHLFFSLLRIDSQLVNRTPPVV